MLFSAYLSTGLGCHHDDKQNAIVSEGPSLASPFDVSAMSVPSLFFATLNQIFSISEFILSTIRLGTQQYPGLVPRVR